MLCLKSATINWEMCFWNFRTIERVAPSQLMDFINKKHLLTYCPLLLAVRFLDIDCNGDVARTASAGAQFSQFFEFFEFVKAVSVLTAVLTAVSSFKCVKWVKSTQIVGIASSPRQLPHLRSQNMEAPFNFNLSLNRHIRNETVSRSDGKPGFCKSNFGWYPWAWRLATLPKKISYWMNTGAWGFFPRSLNPVRNVFGVQAKAVCGLKPGAPALGF